jgi:hypothetical protein
MALLPAPSNPAHDAMGSAGLPHHAMPTRNRLGVETSGVRAKPRRGTKSLVAAPGRA